MIEKKVSQQNKPSWLSPAGGENKMYIKIPIGSAENNIKGCLLPHLPPFLRSDKEPINGSETASKKRAITEAIPA
tara:strand:+ start:15058 stop:15282 length:225 start_codon:yes stop_codon:yes gene_type:complete